MLINHTHERLAGLGLPGMAKPSTISSANPMPPRSPSRCGSAS
jgi:hypothetical protein